MGPAAKKLLRNKNANRYYLARYTVAGLFPCQAGAVILSGQLGWPDNRKVCGFLQTRPPLIIDTGYC
jgi:hypothetical protein